MLSNYFGQRVIQLLFRVRRLISVRFERRRGTEIGSGRLRDAISHFDHRTGWNLKDTFERCLMVIENVAEFEELLNAGSIDSRFELRQSQKSFNLGREDKALIARQSCVIQRLH